MLGKCACHPTAMLEHRLNRSATTIQSKPQQIAEATWLAIEKAVVAGMGYSEASRAFKVSVHAIIMKRRRNRWPVPSRIQERWRYSHVTGPTM